VQTRKTRLDLLRRFQTSVTRTPSNRVPSRVVARQIARAATIVGFGIETGGGGEGGEAIGDQFLQLGQERVDAVVGVDDDDDDG
jgi:hypothetical protein